MLRFLAPHFCIGRIPTWGEQGSKEAPSRMREMPNCRTGGLSYAALKCEIGVRLACWNLCFGLFGMFCKVHGAVGGAQQTIVVDSVCRVEVDSDAGRTMQNMILHYKELVEAAFQPRSDLFDIGPVMHYRNERSELVAAQPRQQIAGAQLPLHAFRHLL